MEFKNTGKFIIWLERTTKTKVYDIQEYLEDVAKQYGETGMTVYEIGRTYTKSGNPETYSFEVEGDTIIF